MIFVLLFFFAELFVSLKVGIAIGFGWSVVWILSTMAIGGILLRLSPYALWNNFQTFNFGRFDVRNVHNASMAYLMGAILLIIPGVLTDLIGAGLLLYTLYLHLFARIRPTPHNKAYDPFSEGDNNVIDVEIIDELDRGDSDRRSS
ncbi:FxsA family protein [Nitratifractor sp.]|uniref:FxsA family protein n=1 Tax=Nitratifractor sp. TaxID=2268144 RepID=UPI0025D1F3FE|nr:FxsA family protein [Nitratifractor sp.]